MISVEVSELLSNPNWMTEERGCLSIMTFERYFITNGLITLDKVTWEREHQSRRCVLYSIHEGVQMMASTCKHV